MSFHIKSDPHPKFAITGNKQFLLLFHLFQHTNVIDSTTRFMIFKSECHEKSAWEERVVHIKNSHLMKEARFLQQRGSVLATKVLLFLEFMFNGI